MKLHYRNSLMIDGGGFTSYFRVIDTLKTKYLLKGFDWLGYDVVNLGDEDLCLGIDFLKKMQEKFKFQFISANVYYKNSEKLFMPPYVVKTFGDLSILGYHIGGFKIGILGVTCAENLPECSNPDKLNLSIKNPILYAKKWVKKLREKCDLVIVLSHLGEKETDQLVSLIDGIDVAICTHAARPLAQARRVMNTVVCQSGARGRYVGQFVVNSKRVAEFSIADYRLVHLDNRFVPSSRFRALLDDYSKKEQQKLNAN